MQAMLILTFTSTCLLLLTKQELGTSFYSRKAIRNPSMLFKYFFGRIWRVVSDTKNPSRAKTREEDSQVGLSFSNDLSDPGIGIGAPVRTADMGRDV